MADKDNKPENNKDDDNQTSDGTKKTDTTGSQDDQNDVVPRSRLNEVINERKDLEARLNKLEEEKREREKAELEEKEEYKELAEKLENQLSEKEVEVTKMHKTTAVVNAAIKAGANDPEDIVKFLDLGKIDVDEDGSVDGVEKQIEALAEEKKYLFSSGNKNIGSDTATGGGEGGKRIWLWSEVAEKRKDQAWYEEHKEELDKASEEGRIDFSQ